MKRDLFRTIALILILFISGCEWQNAAAPGSNNISRGSKKRNVILFIGDGMGVAQLYAGMTVSPRSFSLEKFPYSGLCKTYSADNYITDSAAGGTAISSGIKTNNGMIGVGPDSAAVSSIIEIAHKKGFATGVVSTSAITHATPASFIAHNSGRGNYEDIAKDFLNGTVDVFIGGGEDHFRNRKDGADLTTGLKAQGFDVVYTLEEMKNSKSEKIAGLLAKVHMPRVSAGRAGALEEMTKKAIETLSLNRNGFFLMVEGSMIDWGAHDKNIDYVVEEMIDLDKAISVALNYAAGDGNTLVVVTADHETGGLTLTGGNLAGHKVTANFSVGDHTSVMVPIFSFGPGAERFSGIHENTFFLDEFLRSLNIKK
jgi:alkaline phosphatase